MAPALQDVVVAYWRYQDSSRGDRGQRLEADEYFWAWEVVEAAVGDDPDVLVLLDALLEAPDADPCYLGAGPIENLLVSDGERWAASVAARCRRSGQWLQAVACVWLPAGDRPVELQPFLRPDRLS